MDDVVVYDEYINYELIFENCIFLKDLNLEKTVFETYVDFSRSVFLKNINLKYTTFIELVSFKNVILNESLEFNLEDTFIYKKILFLNIKSAKKIKKQITEYSVESINLLINKYEEDLNIKNRETARIIKDSFEQQNNIIEANKFYALEMKEREKELSWRKDFFEWIVFKIHAVSSNHSQDWLLSLFWILNISFVTSIFSSMLNEKSDVLQYLDKTLSMVFIIVVLGVILFNLKRYIGNLALILLSGVIYFVYYKFFGTLSLDCIANKINPFSVMNSWDNLTFGEFIYKIIIAYLIYQLIISIRQNTRRK